jgi:hypothetical protein
MLYILLLFQYICFLIYKQILSILAIQIFT